MHSGGADEAGWVLLRGGCLSSVRVPCSWSCSGEPAALLGTTLPFAFLLPVTYDSLGIQTLEFTLYDGTEMSYGQGSRKSHK